MRAMRDEGYDIADLPADGDALIQALMAEVVEREPSTSWRKNTHKVTKKKKKKRLRG